MQTINQIIPTEKDLKNSDYNYQIKLTAELDDLDSDFDQNIINKIVLWKVNRYAALDIDTINLINEVKKPDKEINPELSEAILLKLLKQKGIRLAMASTILRFKNPTIYQILDQRVYRFIYGKDLKYSITNVSEQVKIYLTYLVDLRIKSNQHNIAFENADRVFYSMDKSYNSDLKLNGFS